MGKWDGRHIEHSCVKVHVRMQALRGTTEETVPITLKDTYNDSLRKVHVNVTLPSHIAKLLQSHADVTREEAFRVECSVWEALKTPHAQRMLWKRAPKSLEYCPGGTLLEYNTNGFCLPAATTEAAAEALCAQSLRQQVLKGTPLADGMLCVIPVHMPTLAQLVVDTNGAGGLVHYVKGRLAHGVGAPPDDSLELHAVLRAVLEGWDARVGDSMHGREWTVLGVSQWGGSGPFKLECFGGKRRMGETTAKGAAREAREESALHFPNLKRWRDACVNGSVAHVFTALVE